MRTKALIANTAILAGVSTGLAAPAWANFFEGKYDVSSSDGTMSTWWVTPCGSGCRHIASSTGLFDTNAQLQNGRWVWNSKNPRGIKCGDGTSVPANESYTLDATTLSGTIHGVSLGPACGLPSMEADQAISLIRVADNP